MLHIAAATLPASYNARRELRAREAGGIPYY
jgi:hypothetical protein